MYYTVSGYLCHYVLYCTVSGYTPPPIRTTEGVLATVSGVSVCLLALFLLFRRIFLVRCYILLFQVTCGITCFMMLFGGICIIICCNFPVSGCPCYISCMFYCFRVPVFYYVLYFTVSVYLHYYTLCFTVSGFILLFQGTFKLSCFGHNTVHGFVLWFDVGFPQNITLTTSPYERYVQLL